MLKCVKMKMAILKDFRAQNERFHSIIIKMIIKVPADLYRLIQ